MLSYQCRDSHVKDKTVSSTILSLTWESPYLAKMVFILRWGPGDYPQENATGFHICWSLACHLFAEKPLPGLDISKIFTCPTSKIMHDSDHLTKNLIHWGRVTHICVAYLTIIVSDNCLSPSRRQAIIWTNAGILLIKPLGTNFSEILIEIHSFSFTKMHLKMSSGKWRPFCLSLNVLKENFAQIHLPNWLFYWSPIIGQWNRSSPQLP